MGEANASLATHFDETEAVEISRRIWEMPLWFQAEAYVHGQFSPIDGGAAQPFS
jgi:hypothetical protein